MEELQTRKLFIIQIALIFGPLVMVIASLSGWIPYFPRPVTTILFLVMVSGILMGFILAFRKSLTTKQRMLHAGLSMAIVVLFGVATVMLTVGMSRR